MSDILFMLLPVVVGIGLAAVGNRMASGYISEKTSVLCRTHWQLVALYVFLPITFTVIAVIQRDALTPIALVKALVGLFFITTLAIIDYKKQILPNKLLLIMLGVWAAIVVAGLAVNVGDAVYGMIRDLSGGVFAAIVFGMVYIATKRQLGGGDVKLSAVMGLYLSDNRIMGAILYGVVACAIFSIAMLLMKKMGKKDAIPLAPFLAFGYLVTLFFTL